MEPHVSESSDTEEIYTLDPRTREVVDSRKPRHSSRLPSPSKPFPGGGVKPASVNLGNQKGGVLHGLSLTQNHSADVYQAAEGTR
jgi:hypothetical protein